MKYIRACMAGAVLIAASIGSTWAATSVKVVEDGEGGGKMTLKLEPQSVKAGDVEFSVKNDAVSEEHEMIVVHLKSADEAIPMNASSDRVDEDKLESLGEVEDLKPGTTGSLKATLQPGTYLVFCNIKGHYNAGMSSKLTVTP